MDFSTIALAVIALLLLILAFLVVRGGKPGSTLTAEQIRQQVQDAARESLISAQETLNQATELRLQTAQGTFEAQNRLATESLNALLNPLKDTIKSLDTKVTDLEKNRAETFATLTEQVSNTRSVLDNLRTETTTLSSALRRSDTRGRWGELKLRRLVEMIGMEEHKDFVEQKQQLGEGSGRPDMTVFLPQNRVIYIDSKAPMDSYMSFVAEQDAQLREEHMKQHVAAIQTHLKTLESRKYHEDEQSVDYVIMFMPTESSLADACEFKPELIEEAAARKIALVSPTSLMAILSNVSRVWQTERQLENAADILNESTELHKRLGKFMEHIGKIGSSLDSAVDAFNKTVSSFETRLLPNARRIESLANLKEPLKGLKHIDSAPTSTSYGDGQLELEDK